ncbi:MAG: DNA-3-methyladenine glycosylase 2 family protein [Actinobacteria bacterium]|nr:DNA-3-methyladenine glycosylase 2 family protein [Actinomycetota bacterium]
MARVSWKRATAELAARDPALATLIARAGPIKLRPRNTEGSFPALVRSITFQQLAGKAAASIHGRFRALVDGDLTPEAVLALPEDAMRGAGLSGAKTASIRDLATKVLEGTVTLDGIDSLDDDEIVERLVTVRGIGRWTAEMFLLFQLRRMDVWPVDDLAVRAGYGLIHGLPVAPKAKELLSLGDGYQPYRSVATLYCYEAVHLSRGNLLL